MSPVSTLWLMSSISIFEASECLDEIVEQLVLGEEIELKQASPS